MEVNQQAEKLKQVEVLLQFALQEKVFGTDYYNQNTDRLVHLENRIKKLKEIKQKLLVSLSVK